MQTLQQELKEGDRTKQAAQLIQYWRSRLACECSSYSTTTRESIIRWLLGDDLEQFELLDCLQLALAKQAIVYRYNILQQRYLGVAPVQAYRHLTNRLASLVLVRNKIRALLPLSQDRNSTLVDVLQELIQELLQRDRYMHEQMAWIAKCTSDSRLRTALLLTSTEEYCLRPIRNQPLLMYRFFTYFCRKQQGGVTQVPQTSSFRLYSDELLNNESKFQLSDIQAQEAYQDAQVYEEKLAIRQIVKQEFSSYLAQQVGENAVQWLNLYLQGKSQEAIAQQLNLSIKQVYRLREKISYHAVRVFGLKYESELVNSWLDSSPEQSFGLTPQQWQQFWNKLTPRQQQVIELKKQRKSMDAIAQVLNTKINQITKEWHQLCLTAHALRNEG